MTLVARDTSVSRILDRWSQIGGTVIVNSAEISGGPVSVQLTDVSERDALEILLRATDGYIIAERDDPAGGVSSISKILILPKSSTSRSQPPPFSTAAFDRPASTAPADAQQPQQAFVPAPPDFVQPVPPPSPAAPTSASPGFVSIPTAGTSRPGEVTAPAQLPPLFTPGSAPTAQPGQAPPPTPSVPQSHPPVPPGIRVP